MNKAEKIKYWREMIRCQKKSKQDVESWCKENNVAVSSYYKWKKKLEMAKDAEEPFLPVMIDKPLKDTIALEVNGITIQFDKELLPDIMQAIK